MSSKSTPTVSGSTSPADASGYLLLTIQHAIVRQVHEGERMTLARGEMRLECVTLPIPPEIGHQTANPFSPSPADPPIPTHDLWLVLQVGTFEMPLIPGQNLVPQVSSDGLVYTITSPHVKNAHVEIGLPSPCSTADLEDLDSFEVLLRQYTCLESTALANVVVPPLGSSRPPMSEELRGRLLLVNEENGEVMGELDHQLDVEEAGKLVLDDKNRPVVFDFGNVVDGYAPKVVVQSVPEDEMGDWMLKSAHHISRGILSLGGWTSRMMHSSVDLYIQNSTPSPEPVKFSQNTKDNVRRAHSASVKTVRMTKTTVGIINNAIMKIADTTLDKGVVPMMNAYENAQGPLLPLRATPPPVPPQIGTTSPPLPPQTPSPQNAVGEKVPLPTQTETLLAESTGRDTPPPFYSEQMSSEPRPIDAQSAVSDSTRPKPKRAFLGRLILAGEVVLTSLEATTHDLITTGTAAASSAAGHKHGDEAGRAAALLGGSVRNVAVVYIDVRGIGRRAILKSTAKGFVKARLKNGDELRLQGESREGGDVEVGVGELEKGKQGEIVVGMMEAGKSTAVERQSYNEEGLVKRGWVV